MTAELKAVAKRHAAAHICKLVEGGPVTHVWRQMSCIL